MIRRSGSGSRENRETPCETQPFREEGLGRCGCCCGFGRDDQKKTWFQRGATETIDLAQAALHPVAYDGGADTPRDNDRCTRHGIRGFRNPHAQETPVLMTAGQLDQSVLATRTEPRFTRQSGIRRLRPGCGGRNEPRPPSGGDACGLGGGGGSGLHARLWWPCGHGSRTDAYAYAWKVGRCASCRKSLKRIGSERMGVRGVGVNL